MEIRRLLQPNNMGYTLVVETTEGKFASFQSIPTREIKPSDLHMLPYYRAIGRSAEEAPDYMYKMYGLTR